jgi:hypothetical protein
MRGLGEVVIKFFLEMVEILRGCLCIKQIALLKLVGDEENNRFDFGKLNQHVCLGFEGKVGEWGLLNLRNYEHNLLIYNLF